MLEALASTIGMLSLPGKGSKPTSSCSSTSVCACSSSCDSSTEGLSGRFGLPLGVEWEHGKPDGGRRDRACSRNPCASGSGFCVEGAGATGGFRGSLKADESGRLPFSTKPLPKPRTCSSGSTFGARSKLTCQIQNRIVFASTRNSDLPGQVEMMT